MTLEQAIRRKELAGTIGCYIALTTLIVATLFTGYWTFYDGLVSAFNAVFHTKDASQFVFGFFRFWFGAAISACVGALCFYLVSRPCSWVERYYMRQITRIKKENNNENK